MNVPDEQNARELLLSPLFHMLSRFSVSGVDYYVKCMFLRNEIRENLVRIYKINVHRFPCFHNKSSHV